MLRLEIFKLFTMCQKALGIPLNYGLFDGWIGWVFRGWGLGVGPGGWGIDMYNVEGSSYQGLGIVLMVRLK